MVPAKAVAVLFVCLPSPAALEAGKVTRCEDPYSFASIIMSQGIHSSFSLRASEGERERTGISMSHSGR